MFTMLEEVEAELEAIEKLTSLKDKISRTTKFLKELKTLSKSCQEIMSCPANPGDESNDEALRERQVFIRRIVQLRAEIEDGRDLVLALCKSFLPEFQWRIIAEDLQEDCENEESEADLGFGFVHRGTLSYFDIDPSVRFFGIDWESIFGRCFSLSLNANIFGDQILSVVRIMKLSNDKSDKRGENCDLVLVNRILRDLASLQADVTSHAEAVLQGRLSKSQRRLIQKEQLKYSTQASFNPAVSKPVAKSRSFRDPNKSQATGAKSRQGIKYKKNKTTNLDKLTLSPGIKTPVRGSEESSIEPRKLLEPSNMIVTATKASGGSMTTIVSAVPHSSSLAELQLAKKKSSFIQNVSSMLKNIR